jgi:hypothetical protein
VTALLFLAATTALTAWVVAGTAITRRRHQPPPADSAGLDWIPPHRVVRGHLITWTPDDDGPTTPLPAPDSPDYRPQQNPTPDYLTSTQLRDLVGQPDTKPDSRH